MMKVCFGGLLAASTCATVVLTYPQPHRLAIAQTAKSSDLYYLYFGQKIPLKLRQDVLVAEGKAPSQLSGSDPYYRTLRRHLRGGGTLSGDDNSNPPGVQLDPIGNQYVLVSLPNASQARREQIRKAIQAEQNLKATLPVLTLGDRASSVLVLPNRILVSFKSGISEADIQTTLKRRNLEIISKEPFADTLYVVRSKGAAGTAILNVANQLSQETGVEYATPDFIQVPAAVPVSPLNQTLESKSSGNLLDILGSLPTTNYSPASPALLPLQWNLDSTPLSQCLTPSSKTWECLFTQPSAQQAVAKRTDIRAKEAWKESSLKGRGVVVAVIDSLVQSDHPDLDRSLYRVSNSKCPKEEYGWDFTNTEANQGAECPSGDPVTAIDLEEIEGLKERLRDSEILTDSQLDRKYPDEKKEAQQKYCQKCSPDMIVRVIRLLLKGYVEGSFHGTNVAGVIAANSTTGEGLLGVAPNAKILPIRALGLGGTGQDSAIGRAIRYAAARKADIINLSLGPNFPVVNPAIAIEIAKVLAANPNLVIVASAGNEAKEFPGFVMPPGCIPGVVSVGATNLAGKRATYSNFGYADWPSQYPDHPEAKLPCGAGLKQSFPNLDKDDPLLDFVAPGGQLGLPDVVEGYSIGGVFTTGGTFVPGLWLGWKAPNRPFQNALKTGVYVWTQGTSFSAPTVAGVFALMKAEDPQRKLTRQQLVKILKQTASYKNLDVSPDMNQYQTQKQKGTVPNGVSPEQYFFGSGLVNAEAAVQEVKRQVGR